MKERNHTIDFFRGIAAISIIIHHVASYSGVVYSPYAIIPLTMLIDVPAFLFIAGWSFCYNRDWKSYLLRIVRLVFSSVIFSLLYVLFIEIFDVFHKGESVHVRAIIDLWLSQSLFRGELHDIFSVVNASLWFMPLYIKVYLLLGVIVLIFSCFVEDERTKGILGALLTAVFFGFFFYLQTGRSIPGVQIDVVFYGFFFLLGYFGSRISVSFRRFYILLFLLTAGAVVWMEFFTEKKLEGMQFNKFPPNMMFWAYSMLFIYVILFFKEVKISERSLFAKIGRSALYFFWGQGFAVSIINQVDDYIVLPWFWKYTLSCAAGIILAACFAFVIKFIVENLWKQIYQKLITK